MEILNKALQGVHDKERSPNISRKIRILQVITVLGTGGASNVVLDLANHFNAHPNFDVQLLTGPIPTGRTDLTYLAEERGITTRVIPSLINHINPVVNAKAVADIRRIIIREKI